MLADVGHEGLGRVDRLAVDLGDDVAVQGPAAEFSGQTQIAAGTDVAVCDDGSASDLPEPAQLDLPAGDAEREPLEGMLVAPADTLTVTVDLPGG